MKAEVEAMAGGNGIVICDRGVPDILAHMRTAMAAEATGDRLASVVSNICFQWTKTYDMIFMTQPVPDRPIRRDGFRRWGKVKQIETHKALLSIMKSLMVVAILLPSADDERLLIIGGMLGLLDGDA
jgi:predicted ATPase